MAVLTPAAPLITPNPVKISLPGYTKGSLGTYAGVLVSSSGPNGPNVAVTFHSTAAGANFFTDMAQAQLYTTYSADAFGQSVSALNAQHAPGGNAVQVGGVTFDHSVFDYLNDYFNANA